MRNCCGIASSTSARGRRTGDERDGATDRSTGSDRPRHTIERTPGEGDLRIGRRGDHRVDIDPAHGRGRRRSDANDHIRDRGLGSAMALCVSARHTAMVQAPRCARHLRSDLTLTVSLSMQPSRSWCAAGSPEATMRSARVLHAAPRNLVREPDRLRAVLIVRRRCRSMLSRAVSPVRVIGRATPCLRGSGARLCRFGGFVCRLAWRRKRGGCTRAGGQG